jgi:hypothetical protein
MDDARLFAVDEASFELMHTALCPGGDLHVPGACQPFHSIWSILEKTEAHPQKVVDDLVESGRQYEKTRAKLWEESYDCLRAAMKEKLTSWKKTDSEGYVPHYVKDIEEILRVAGS